MATDNISYTDVRPGVRLLPEAMAPGGVDATSFALRDGSHLTLIRPAAQPVTAVSLRAQGSYLCASLAGQPVVRGEKRSRPLPTHKLHILRQPAGAAERRIEFGASVSLALLIFFSSQWCQLCPRGPACQVARFLLRGHDRMGVGDQSLDLDADGLAFARMLLNLHIDEDADTLRLEQSVLALLSWAFAKDKAPLATMAPQVPLSPRTAMKARQAAEVLRQRLEDPPTITELSRLVGLNGSDLKRCFKCLYGSSIASYSRRTRLEAARDLLTHSPHGVARIAFEVGFANPSQFARAFRQQFGLNPSQFRRSPQ